MGQRTIGADMADATGDQQEGGTAEAAPPRSGLWHDERPSYIDDEECRRALEELLNEAGVAPSRLRSRSPRP
jgi:hypothetical protein